MKFNSQICTTREQSERLLALGLKRETADMNYQIQYLDLGGVLKECTPSLNPYPPLNNDRFIPAWSLDRLIELLKDESVPNYSIDFYVNLNRYDEIISLMQSLIHMGHFNKNYLDIN